MHSYIKSPTHTNPLTHAHGLKISTQSFSQNMPQTSAQPSHAHAYIWHRRNPTHAMHGPIHVVNQFFFANVFVWAGIENCSVLAIDSSMYLTVDVEVHSRWMHHPCVIKQNLYNSFHIKTNNEQYCCLQEPSSSATLKVSQNSVHSSMTVSVTACDYQEIQC